MMARAVELKFEQFYKQKQMELLMMGSTVPTEQRNVNEATHTVIDLSSGESEKEEGVSVSKETSKIDEEKIQQGPISHEKMMKEAETPIKSTSESHFISSSPPNTTQRK